MDDLGVRQDLFKGSGDRGGPGGSGAAEHQQAGLGDGAGGIKQVEAGQGGRFRSTGAAAMPTLSCPIGASLSAAT